MQIRLGTGDEVSAFEDAPEQVKAEIDGNADVVGDESLVIECGGECIKPVEEDDETEEDACCVTKVGLEGGLEGELVAVNALGLAGVVEANVGDADGNPAEERGDGGEVLEPGENLRGAGGG